jgi:type IV secretory pathway VirJ component
VKLSIIFGIYGIFLTMFYIRDLFTLFRCNRWQLVLLFLLVSGSACAALSEETVDNGVGALHMVHPEDAPKGLVLFLLGVQGWDSGAVATAQEVANQGHLVVGIDWSTLAANNQSKSHWWDVGAAFSRLLHWFNASNSNQEIPISCWDVSADLARITRWVNEHESIPQSILPILLGETEGAALVYVALLQAAPNRFHAAVSLGFCPTWPTAMPACQREGFTAALIQDKRLLPATQVSTAWFMFDSGVNPMCPADSSADFIKQIANARMSVTTSAAALPPGTTPENVPASTTQESTTETDEDLSPLASLFQWLDPSLPDQVGKVSTQGDTSGLPLLEVRAAQENRTTFAIMLSGDGGWATLDRAVSSRLAERGISTVSWDSLSYFWKARSPAEASTDLARVMRHYLKAWDKQRVILIGFSLGAEVLPFMANQLPDDLRSQVELVALLSVGRTALFQFHLSDWLDIGRGNNALPELPQVRALDWTQRLCIYGEEDDESLCPDLIGINVEIHKLAGDHHFNEDYVGVADIILGQKSLAIDEANSSSFPTK